QVEPVPPARPLRARRPAVERPPGGVAARGDLPPRPALRRLRQPGPPTARTGVNDRTVVIDCFPDSAARYAATHTIVAVDVIRATTTAVSAVASGRRCFPVPSLETAVPLAARLDNPLLVGELGGNAPYGFHLTNSPAQITPRPDVQRPMILLSTSGTPLMWEARRAPAAYAACLRNVSAQAEHPAASTRPVAVIGAGSRNEFRDEDALCCAWITAGL